MRRNQKICAALLCAVFFLTGVTNSAHAAEPGTEQVVADYTYVLERKSETNATPAEGDNPAAPAKLTLRLSVRPGDSVKNPLLSGGSFALRFPKRMGSGAKFVPNATNMNLNPIYPGERYPGGKLPGGDDPLEIKKDTYLAFSWTRNPGVTAWFNGETQKNELVLGTFEIIKPTDAFPTKGEIGQMDFLSMEESIPKELPEANRGNPADNPFNASVWNNVTKSYQGYYPAADATIQQTDLALSWTPPSEWKNAITLMAYDPKKPMTMQLFKAESPFDPVSSPTVVEQWKTGQSLDTGMLYAATEANRNTGIGAYFWAITFQEFMTPDDDNPNTPPANIVAEVGKEYILRISKPGHLTMDMKLKATSTNFAECEGFPAADQYFSLPCGDVNPVSGIYGDGEIKLSDRVLLTAYLNGGMKAASPLSPTVSGNPNPAYYADLDGDGAITLKDMSILLSFGNYNKTANKNEFGMILEKGG